MFKNGRSVEEVFGAPEEDIKKRLEDAKTANEKATKLETDLAASTSELNSVKATLAKLEGKLTELTAPPVVKVDPPALTSFEDDPEKATAERLNQALLPIQISNMELQASLVYDRVKSRHQDWSLVQDKIDDLLKNTHLSARVHEATVENAYLIAWAKHSKEKLAAGETLVETGGNSGNNGHGAEKKDPVKDLTEDDKKMAAAYGMSLEDWAKAKAELRVI